MTPPPAKPIVIVAAPSAYGHTAHLLPHAAHLCRRGYEVFFLAGPQFERAVSRTGATFVATPNTWTAEALADSAKVPEGQTPFVWEQRVLFVDGTPACSQSLKKLLEDVRARFPEREVVIVEEMLFMGSWPFILGAPLPRGYHEFPKVVSFSSIPIWVTSMDTAPFANGLPPDGTPAGRAHNARLQEEMGVEHAALAAHANGVYAALGATERIVLGGGVRTMFDAWATRHVLLQPCTPSLEYPRADLPTNIRFIGGAPRPALDPSTALPAWWGDIAANKAAAKPRKVVFVTQGTVVSDFGNLIGPTLRGLEGREDVLVVAVLGARGAELGFEAPANARVVDYLVYHAVLPHADVFVSNGGYGGFMQAVMYGVPMVLAGTTQDKAEVSMRGEWAGVVVNLRTDTPTPEAVRDGVDRVLEDERFAIRAAEIRKENEELDPLGQLEGIINGVTQ